jgi:hypothetical protein
MLMEVPTTRHGGNIDTSEKSASLLVACRPAGLIGTRETVTARSSLL